MRKEVIAFFVLLAIACIYFYSTTFSHQFTYFDDHVQIVENPYLQTFNFKSVKAIFSNTFVGMYQPVTTLISLVVASLFGIEGSAFHGVSVLFHLVNALLVFRILSHFKLKLSVVFFLTAIFVLHPMQVESVAWASAFSTLIFTFFSLSSFIFYLKFTETKDTSAYIFALILFLLACLSKSAAVILPLILVAYDWFKNNSLKINYINKIPFFGLSILFGIVTILSRKSSGHLSDLSETYSFFDRLVLIANTILFYPFKFIIPINLSAFYPYPQLIESHLPYYFYFSVPILLGLLFVIYKFRRNKLLWFGSLWFLAGIFLVLQFIPVGNQITTDRYIYFPMIGLLLILGHFLSKIKSKPILYSLLILPLLLGFLSQKRTAIWQNDKTLWNSVLEEYPNVAQAYNNLGSYSLKEGNPRVAFQQFNKAIELQGNYADAYSNRGNILSEGGNTEAAIADFTKAISLEPHADALFNRANEYVKLKKHDLALADYTASINLNENADTYTNRAYAYLNLKQFGKATADLQKAIRLNPNFDRAYLLLGMTEIQKGNQQEACKNLKKAALLGNKNATNAISKFCR